MSGGYTGRLFAELDASDSGVCGTIGLHDDVQGVSVFACAGRFDAETLELTCTPPSPAYPGEMRLSGARQSDGAVMGTWTSTGGASGAFVLFPDPR